MAPNAGEEEVVAYYDEFVEHLKNDDNKQNPRHTHLFIDLCKLVRPAATVLDLGCGTGITSEYMAQMGCNVLGVDISPKMIEYANAHHNHHSVAYRVGNVTRLQFGKTFDRIIMCDMFEHIPRTDINAFMKVLKKHSHDGTIMYLNIPDGRYQFAAHKYIVNRLQIIDEAYSIDKILSLFDSIDFTPLKIEVYGIDVSPQYNSFVFVSKRSLDKTLSTFLTGI